MNELNRSFQEAIEKWISELLSVNVSLPELKDWSIFHKLIEKMYGSQPGMNVNENSYTVINRMEAFYHFNFYSFLSINPSDILFLSSYELAIISSLILTMGLKVSPDIFMKPANSIPIQYHKNIVAISSSILENINLNKDSFEFLCHSLPSMKENIFSPSSCPEILDKTAVESRTPLRPINRSEIAIDTPMNQDNFSFMFSPLISVHNDKIRMLKLQLNDQIRLCESTELALELARNQIEIETQKNITLTNKLNAKEAIIKDFQDEIDCLHAEKTSMEELNDKYEKSLSQISNLNSKITSLNKHIKSLSSINASLKEKIFHFENEDANRSRKWKDGLKDVQASLQKIDLSVHQNQESTERLFSSQPAIKSSAQKSVQVNIKEDCLSSPLVSGEKISTILEADRIENLQNELEEAHSFIVELKEKILEKDSQLGILRQKDEELETKINENEIKLRSEILNKEEEINRLRQEIILIKQSELKESERHSEEILIINRKLELAKLQLGEKREEFERIIQEKDEKIQDLQSLIHSERKNVDSVEYVNIELKEEIENLKALRRSEQEDIKRVRNDLSRHLKNMEDKDKEQKRLKETYEKKIESLEAKLLQNIEKIEFDKKKYLGTIQDLEFNQTHNKTKLEEQLKNNHELTLKISKLETKIKVGEQRLEESENKSNSLSKELKEAVEVVKNSKKIISDLENEIQSYEYRLANMEDKNHYLNDKLSKLSTTEHVNEELKNQIESLKQHQQALVSKLVKLECDNEELNQHLELLRQSKKKSDSLRSLPVLETDLSFTRPGISTNQKIHTSAKPDESFRSNLSEFQERAERLLVRSERINHPLPPIPMPETFLKEPEYMFTRTIDEEKRFDESSLSTATDVYSQFQRYRSDNESVSKVSRSGTMENRNTCGSFNTDYQSSLADDDQSSLKRHYQICNSTPDLTDLNNDGMRSSSQRSNKKGKYNLFNKIKKSKTLKFA